MVAEADDAAILVILALVMVGAAALVTPPGGGEHGDVARMLHAFRRHADRLGRNRRLRAGLVLPSCVRPARLGARGRDWLGWQRLWANCLWANCLRRDRLGARRLGPLRLGMFGAGATGLGALGAGAAVFAFLLGGLVSRWF